jgi:hypothetical protein
MQLSFSTALATLAAVFAAATPAAALFCAEASRFGTVSVSPTLLSPGDVSRLHNLCLAPDQFSHSRPLLYQQISPALLNTV